MSASHDRTFFDTFLLVLGILVGVTIGLIIIARIIAANTSVANRAEDPVYERQVEERIQPVARVAIAGAGQHRAGTAGRSAGRGRNRRG